MSVNTPKELAGYLKSKKSVLLLAGDLCTKIEFDGKRLLDHAAEIARGIGAPVAATGNTRTLLAWEDFFRIYSVT